MKKTRMEKGITLIALIITIVVLLILAAVAISSITNDGILGHAENAATTYNQAVANEQAALDSYLGFLESGESATTFADATKGAMLQKKVNSTVYDEFGNKIVIPAGFKIRSDLAENVTEGIVIEDKDGNQFVWVPVGKIYTDNTAQKETTAKTITLGRYSDFTATNGVYTPATSISDYTEETKTATGLGAYGNAIARDIEAFLASANPETGNGGYYIGRYEAGDATTGNTARTDSTSDTNKLVCKAGQQVYNYVTQPQASSLAKGMYADGYASGTYSSDLINSYAWDTAIIFIQTFGGTEASSYYDDNNSDELTTTGGNQDEYCNINDMSGNAFEWSTETYSNAGYPCVFRGGCYNTSYGGADSYTSGRALPRLRSVFQLRELFFPPTFICSIVSCEN